MNTSPSAVRALRDALAAPRVDDAAAEGQVLGALVTGALTLRDVADVADQAFYYQHARRVFGVLRDLLQLRAEGHRVKGRVGLDLGQALRACEACGVFAGARYQVRRTDGREAIEALGYLPRLAKDAPRRIQALIALRRVEALSEERRIAAGRKARALRGIEGDIARLVRERVRLAEA